jgi:ketosteroid isomerase-like protein
LNTTEAVLERNKAIVTSLLEAFATLDIDAMDALIAIDGIWEIPGDVEQFPLAGVMKKETLLGQLPAVFPSGIRMTPTGMTAEGDRVAVEVRSEGVMADGFLYGNRYHFLFVLRNDKVVVAREYCDTQTAVRLVPHMAATP